MRRLAHKTSIYRTEDIRRIEALAAALSESPALMERAGLAAAHLAGELAQTGRRVVVIAGPGNNGGDAFVVARHLKQAWFNVEVLFAGDAAKLGRDATAAFKRWGEAGGTLVDECPRVTDCGLIVDGLFGIGLQRELTGRYAQLVAWINSAACPVLALDVPSGLESDTGRVLGCAVRATHTVTFIGLKPGLLTLEGPDHCGEVSAETLGLDAPSLVPPTGHIIGGAVLESALPPRRLNTHKGDYGSIGIIGGASGMVGAALLAARAALKLGAGRVYVGLSAQDAPRVDLVQPELMLRRAEEVCAIEHLTALAIGPGLGVAADAQTLLASALATSLPLVLDADALNLTAGHVHFCETLARREAPTVLTPHPAEAARLLGVATAEVQRDRVGSARGIAERFRCGVVLKGAGSVCAWPSGNWAINTSGNPGMASAGMGDVLTGILAALLAQRVTPELALEAGVYLHGAAADTLVCEGRGPTGMTASEVIDAARRLINVRGDTRSR